MQFLVILIILLPSVAIATSAIDEQSSSKQPSIAVMVRVVQLNLPNLKRSVRAPCVHQPCRTPFRAGGSKPEHYNYNYNWFAPKSGVKILENEIVEQEVRTDVQASDNN
ncbi:uncharacterized protein LOC120426383 [Culex pipiens pallens]|uniref:uncharacterized protein LOC120426383 n=1 Tax=Culex pipiens pallens TaxID=42434 RepID=UPI0019537642|nr:uncharacterized protein LOC120426383 [Culex pipiens pallens]